MFTCHKCAGLIAHEKTENVDGLFGCHCMSGYVRDWYEPKTRAEAIQHQIRITLVWIELYKNQGRSQDQIDCKQNRLADLCRLEETQDAKIAEIEATLDRAAEKKS